MKALWSSRPGTRRGPLHQPHPAPVGRNSQRVTRHSKSFHRFWATPLVVTGMLGLTLFSSGTPALAAAPNTTATPAIAITKTADGQSPFDATAGPGNDTGANNGVVRANQLITYQVAMSLNDPTAPSQTTFQDTTATFDPLPLGFAWDSIPVECTGPNTSLTGDGVTTPSVLVCDFGAKTTGTTWTMEARARRSGRGCVV